MTVLRRLVLGAFGCTAAVILVLLGEAVFSAVGWNSDPHGYGVIFGLLCAAVLAPVALVLWMVYQAMRRRARPVEPFEPPVRDL
ncbi:hypothetical protein [Actinoplanes sp. NPDC026619]|uniref:hypothetical protein n=1 Tax=Actinoplanes sp. NPDC026619 TaxID=3155798 RepID=UPI0033EA44D0